MAARANMDTKIDEAELLDRVARGDRMTDIAKWAGVTVKSVYNYLDRRPEKWAAAKVASAESLLAKAEDALLDETAKESSAAASLHRSRSEYYKWLAGCRSEEYSVRPTTEVNLGIVDLGQLHLDALRQSGHMSHVLPPADVEILDEGLPQKRLSASERRARGDADEKKG